MNKDSAEEPTQRLRALQYITDAALTHLSLDDLLRQVLDRITDVLAIDNTAILLLDETGQNLIIHLAHGPEEEVAGQVRIPFGQGIAGRIAASRTPLIVEDMSTEHPVNPFLSTHIRSLMGVPLRVDQRVLGVLHVGTLSPHHFTADDLYWLTLVADRVAMAIDHAQLYEAAQKAHAEASARAGEIEAMFDALADAVFVYDTEGQIRHANAAARALFGMEADSTYPTRPLPERIQLTHTRNAQGQPLPREQWPQLRVLRGESFSGAHAVDVIIRSLDGRDVFISVSGAPIRDPERRVQGGILVLRDVTERREMERRTRATLDALVEMARALVSPPSETPDIVERRNAMGQRLVELTRQVLNCQRVGLIAFDLARGTQHLVAIAGVSPEEERAWRESLDGAPIVDTAMPGDPVHVSRLAAGEAVLIDMTQPPYRDRPNPSGVRTTLVAPLYLNEEIIGILSLDHGGADHTYTADELALASTVAQLAALMLERERLQHEREEALVSERALREANQRMDEFLSIASHELKSPLTGMWSSVQLARRRMQRIRAESQSTEEMQETLASLEGLLRITEQQMNRQRRLIDDLLDISRIQSGHVQLHRTPTDLKDLVRESVDEQRRAWPARTITLDVPDEAVIVLADADRLRQVLTNYISNALKYSGRDRPVAVQLQRDQEQAILRVRDEGPGLTPEQQAQIWDRYRQVSGITVQDDSYQGVGGGLGLGLYISRALIEDHDGRVGVESMPGQGSIFWFSLPLNQTAAPEHI